MICIKKRYFNWNRLLLLSLGLWPDKETKFTRIQARLLFSLLMSSVPFHFSRLFIEECNIDYVIKIIASVTFFIMLIVIFICFWTNMKSMKYLLNQLQHIYHELKDKNEIAIYDKYGYSGKRFTIRLMSKKNIREILSQCVKINLFAVCSLFFAGTMLFSPYILDIVMPKNESYAIHIMKLITKYFRVSEKYYFLSFIYLNAACSAGVIVVIGTGTMILSYFKHACGLFEIASYRMEQAMAIELLHDLNTKNEIIIYKKIICAVDIHRKALQFAKCFMDKLQGASFFLIIATVLCLSCNLFELFQTQSNTEEVEEVILHFFAVIGIVLFLFVTNYSGQEIIDHSNNVYVTTYFFLDTPFHDI
ncbi:uncharacterized protein LOC105285952 [Ooceraea biroi]|uniref:uncharacterized protein LOC105285952 n=1 Tax=Ooceraea biroi TaxID=2015173 RepID=UPI000F08A87B|nr:uncharacterized protein LOC105285952 [Ooceraea biroi]